MLMAMIDDFDENDADTDVDNNDNVTDEDKNDGDDGADADEADGGSNDEGGGGNDEGGNNADGDAKDGGRHDCNDKVDIDFEDDDGVRGEFFQYNFVSISTIFDANLSFLGSIRCK